MEDVQTFIYLGKKVKIYEGDYFVKNELKSRLHNMGIDFDSQKKEKNYFVKLYNKAIKSNANKIKIFDRLLKDTKGQEYADEIKQNSKRKSLETYNYSTNYNNDSPNYKEMNRIPDNLLIKENKDKFLNNRNYRNNSQGFATLLANQIKKNDTPKKMNAFDYERNTIKNKEINFEQNMVNDDDYEQNYNLRNKNNINYKYLYNDFDNNNIPTKSKSPINYNQRNMNYEKYNINQFNNEYNNKPYIQYDYDNNYIQNNRNFDKQIAQKNNYNNNEANEKENIDKRRNRNLFQNKTNNILSQNYTENSRKRENNNNDISIQINDNPKRNYKNNNRNEKEINMLDTNEIDDNSNNEFKEKMDLLLYIILLVSSACLLYFVFRAIFHFGTAVTETVTETVRIVSSPRRLFRDLIWGLIKSILLGIFYQYIHITLPMAIISLIIYKQKMKREFEKLCKQIIEDIKKDLEKKKDKSMSEVELIDYYSKKYNIDKKTFSKKYFKRLKELRKTDPSLKLSESINESGEIEILWELSQ